MRLTSTRSPGRSVSSIDPDGMRYGLSSHAWIASATSTATTTIAAYSRARFTMRTAGAAASGQRCFSRTRACLPTFWRR